MSDILSSVVDVCRALVDKVREMREVSEECRKLAGIVSQLLPIFSDLDYQLRDAQHRQIMSSLSKALNDASTVVDYIIAHPRYTAVWSGTYKKKLEEAINSVDAWIVRIQPLTSGRTLENLDQLKTSVTDFSNDLGTKIDGVADSIEELKVLVANLPEDVMRQMREELHSLVHPQGKDPRFVLFLDEEEKNMLALIDSRAPAPTPAPAPAATRFQAANDSIKSAVALWYSNRAAAESQHGHISAWDTSRVTVMRELFRGFGEFNEDISKWDVSRVTDMGCMFNSASLFKGDLSKWDVSRVTDMHYMFNGASSFNGDLSKWDVSRVTDMGFMFCNATSFRGDLSKWDVSRVIHMTCMFDGASSFDGDLSKWDVSRVINMIFMFCGARSFNGDLSKWDVSRVPNMSSMFSGASSFNGDLSKWDVSQVTDMNYMFRDASSFHGDISKWNVSQVTGMFMMFESCPIARYCKPPKMRSCIKCAVM